MSGWGYYDYGGGGAELYDPAEEKWSFAGDINLINIPMTMTLLRNGNVLVTGESDFGPQRAALYDPITGNWITAGTLSFGTGYTGSWRATLLADGQVLVSGIKSCGAQGRSCSYGAELYDATTGTWSRTSPPLLPRLGDTATLLPNGTALIAGGINEWIFPPTITSVQVLKKGRPITTIVAGTKAKKLSLEVSGLDFDSRAELLVNGEALELVRGSRIELAGRFTQPMVGTPGELAIQVRNSDGKKSNTVTVMVVAGQ